MNGVEGMYREIVVISKFHSFSRHIPEMINHHFFRSELKNVYQPYQNAIFTQDETEKSYHFF